MVGGGGAARQALSLVGIIRRRKGQKLARGPIWLILSILVLMSTALFGYWVLVSSRNATVIVEWSTASELETAGFNLYRSESPEGPFTRINERLIPGSPDPLTGGSYEYLDSDVDAGVTYYYQLEDVETSGTLTRHGPIQVKATGGGRTELLLAIIGFSGVIAGAILQLRRQTR